MFEYIVSLLCDRFGTWSSVGALSLAMSISCLFCLLTLTGPILRPTVIPYPWPETKKENNKTVVFAGSFNPPHKGHLAMLIYLAERYGKLIVVVGMNSKKQYSVTPDERATMIRRMLEHNCSFTNIRVEVVRGYIWRTVKPKGAKLFVRGIRSWEKDGAEERALQIQNIWGPLVLGPIWWPLPTLFLEGNPTYNHVSSTLIRNICLSKDTPTREALKALIPLCIVDDVSRLYGEAT